MSSDKRPSAEQRTEEQPGGGTAALDAATGLPEQGTAQRQSPRIDGMLQWFQMKFYDDLSDIRPEKHGYYKHYVHHFVTSFFTEEAVKGKRILDFGCGPGFYSAILARRGAYVVGIDKSAFLIDKANEHKVRLGQTNAEFIQADFLEYAPRLQAGLFDYVLAIDALVSFDYNQPAHQHELVVETFRAFSRLMKQDGRLMILENHPCFGKVIQEIVAASGECVCIRTSGYKIEHRAKNDLHHWFTLQEMTQAASESGLAVLRIREPDPSDAMQRENPSAYSMRSKYPGMIVYEICKLTSPPQSHRLQ